MATITVKNIPDDLYAALKARAEAHHRSINSEIIVCIERTVRPQRIDVEAALSQARALRRLGTGAPLSDEELSAAKAEGRS
ncbi:MAG: Arc family DNA-binding protein [Anaerolineae bacterium]|nr:Arc family DNA-binding protein [Anaerolineae bacterium]